MSSTMVPQTIKMLRLMFSAYSLPAQFISDKGPQFVSNELTTLLKQNGEDIYDY